MPRRDSHQGQQRCHKLSRCPLHMASWASGSRYITSLFTCMSPYSTGVSHSSIFIPLGQKCIGGIDWDCSSAITEGQTISFLPYKKIIACLSSYQKRVANAKPLLWFSNANTILCTDSLNFTWAAEGMQRRPALKVPLAEENRSIPPPSPSTHWT